MRQERQGRACYLLSLLLFGCVVAGAQTASLSGFIHTEQNAPIQDAQITLTRDGLPLHTTEATTDEHGRYQFSSLSPGTYHLQARHTGFAPSQAIAVSISAATAETRMDLTMKHQSTETSSTDAASRPQFQAAGIRGLIDPGGYSAPANAAAASGLIRGVADINRTRNDATASPPASGSCALEPALQRNVAEKPDNLEALLKLGEFYLEHGQAAKAIPILQHAHSLDPGDQTPLEPLAQAYLLAQHFEEAKKLLIPLSPARDSAEIRRLLAQANEGLGKFAEASQDYQLAAQQQPSDSNLFGVGYELILAGLPKDAARAFAAGVKRYPRSIQLLIGFGSAQYLQGLTSESVQTLLRAIAVDPADPRAYPFLAKASGVTREEAERAQAAFENFLSISPRDPRAPYYCALNLTRLPGTDDRRIEKLLQAAIRLDPNLEEAHYQLAVLYARQGDYQRAAPELETVIRLSPDRQEAHYRLAMAYQRTGRIDLSNREMQLFRTAQEPAKTGSTQSIAQFISVLNPADTAAGGQTVCPGDFP